MFGGETDTGRDGLAEVVCCFAEEPASADTGVSVAAGQNPPGSASRPPGSRSGFYPSPEQTERLQVVLHVFYLIFNERNTAGSRLNLQRTELTGEAIRLTHAAHRPRPHDDETTGLLALMLLTEARRAARTGPDGTLISLADQDRSLWRADLIKTGVELVTRALSVGPIGLYQIQAAIAARHAEAAGAKDTGWPQIVAL